MAVFFKRFVFFTVLICCLWLGSVYVFTQHIPTQPNEPLPDADAIIVLTGGSGRIELGTELLVAGKAPVLFVSGANEEVSYEDMIRLTPPQNRTFVGQAVGSSILLGSNAQNTIGNAAEAKKWLEQTPHQHILLVTSNYHMPRALGEFRFSMPNKRFTPVAVIPKEVTHPVWWLTDSYRSIVLSEYYKFIISNARHWAMTHLFNGNA